MNFDDSHLIIATAVFALTYAVIVWDRFNRAVVALSGAVLMILLGMITQEAAIKGVDFNTLSLLVGMMAMVTISRQTGMFEYVAILSAKTMKGDPWGCLVMLSAVTAVFSALLDNVTTVMLIVPITLLVTAELKVSPYPFLAVEILASNIGGAATLIGDPPNIMIGSAAHLTFMDFIINVAPLMPVIFVATLIPIWFLYGRTMVADPKDRATIMQFNERDAIRDVVLLRKCLGVLGFVGVAFIFQHPLQLEAATIALTGAALLFLISGADFHENIEKIEWTTIFFFIGLFIVVAGVEHAGLLTIMAQWVLDVTEGSRSATILMVLWVSAILSALVDNIPFVATMIPMIHEMEGPMGGEQALLPLWWALSIGACLGGNGSLIGASANVIVAGFADRAGHPIGFVRFLKLGFPLMLMSLVIATGYVYWRFI